MHNSPLHILAFETSLNASGSVAVLQGDELIESTTLPIDRRSAVTLAPAMQELLSKLQWHDRVQLVSVVRGPGSFTGLRIGVTAAKMLSYTWNVPVVGVLATDCIALQVVTQLGAKLNELKLNLRESDAEKNPSEASPNATSSFNTPQFQKISVAIDAHRQQVFTADYIFNAESSNLRLCKQTRLLDIDEWLETTEPGTYVSGPALEKHSLLEKLQHRTADQSSGIIIAPQSTWLPQASSAGILAWHRFRDGELDDPFQLAPLYLRPSYAEEKKVNS